MKKMVSFSVILGISMVFVGCAYKTEYGVDGCGNSYTDKTYRTMSNNCEQKCVNNSLNINRDTCSKPIKKVEAKITAPKNAPILEKNKTLRITVKGQGVAPMRTTSPAQAYALAKRAAVADSYRLIAEKVKGVYVEGSDLVQNMMVKRSTVRTSVKAMVRNANVVETIFKDGLCEVEMEIVLSHAQFAQ